VPFVLKIDALEVREEASWGVRRPLWGRTVERIGEERVIRQADLVVPVSPTLDSQLASLGIPSEQRLVLGNGVDLDDFSPGPPNADFRVEHDLRGRLVVGWVGGFRPYHGLSLVPDVARLLRDAVPEAVLCLVGTGDLFDAISESVDDVRDSVRLVGSVPHDRVADWIRTFDVCLLLADPGPYHYSPLKLYEYMACGRPVVAAAVGDVADALYGDAGGILVPPGDANAVVNAVARLAADPSLRKRMGVEARTHAERLGGWEARAGTLVDALRDRSLLSQSFVAG
jgi:glycosyltransferase involved in cell wall biosynthesis